MNTKPLWIVYLGLMLGMPVPILAQEEEAHTQEEGGGAIEMTPDERREAGITVDPVTRRALDETIRVPAEVVVNAYQSARVTPRITAQVAARHVRLGDLVKLGQPLVTLSSVEMAEAQGQLIVANREWQRVRSLGRDIVSERRFTEAQVARQQALARVIAYGMTEAQAEGLMNGGDASKATGAFDLLAPQAGTVLRDDFIVGELIEPGRVLFEISDESTMWVEAQTVPATLGHIENGASARVSVDGDYWIEGTVLERHHQLNETTRTLGLRIEVDNSNDTLHAGQFVQAEVVTGKLEPALAVPDEALTLIDGLPTVFRLEDGTFHATAIRTGPTVGNWTIVHGGISEGDDIAVSGVFHIKSLMLKSSMGEGHGH
jgi:cobalt-zinc-cadmium efflux system membrane fusion protein